MMNKTTAAPFNLTDHGLTVSEVHRNLPPSSLYEHAIHFEKDASIAENGALVAYSGVKTGARPKTSASSSDQNRKAIFGGARSTSLATSGRFKSIDSVRSIISTHVSGFIASMVSPVGTLNTASKCA